MNTTLTTPNTDGAIGTDPIGTANPVTGGTIGGADTLGGGNANTGDVDTATIPTGSHGGGMGSGTGLDVDALEESENDDEIVTTSGPLSGDTDNEQSGTVGTGQTTKVGGGI